MVKDRWHKAPKRREDRALCKKKYSCWAIKSTRRPRGQAYSLKLFVISFWKSTRCIKWREDTSTAWDGTWCRGPWSSPRQGGNPAQCSAASRRDTSSHPESSQALLAQRLTPSRQGWSSAPMQPCCSPFHAKSNQGGGSRGPSSCKKAPTGAWSKSGGQGYAPL